MTERWQADTEDYDAEETRQRGCRPRRCSSGASPTLSSKTTQASCSGFAARVEAAADADWQQEPYRALRQNALRMLIASSPDFQTS